MSFLSRSSPILRQLAVARPSPRLFTTTVICQKGPIEAGKDVLKAVDRTVSDTIVAGIDKGAEVKESVISTTSSEASKAAGSAQETAGQVQGEAAKLSGQAEGKAAELAGKAKGKIEEVKGEL